jgi:hypothetical protein
MDVLPATLHLRGADEALRILWPREAATNALAVVAGDPDDVPVVATAIAAGGAIAVLLPAPTPLTARAVCGWFADHATELGADPLALTLVTVGLSYDAALALADAIADDGWPPVDIVIGPDVDGDNPSLTWKCRPALSASAACPVLRSQGSGVIHGWWAATMCCRSRSSDAEA